VIEVKGETGVIACENGLSLGSFACGQLAKEAAAGAGFYDGEQSVAVPSSKLTQWQIINTTEWHASDALTVKNIASYAQYSDYLNDPLFGTNFATPAIPGIYPSFTVDFAHPGPPPGAATANENTYTEEIQFQGNAFDHRFTWQGGLYFAQLPKIQKLDVRLEGGSTSPVDFSTCNGCFYHNFQYVNGFTNGGQLMASWIGRAAQGESITSNYWLSATRKIGIALKHRKIDRAFLPQGGTQNDVQVNSDFLLRSGFRLSGSLQYERWEIPLLAANRQSNVTASFEFSFLPKVGRK